MDFSVFATSEAWISLLMLTFMEIVLGIDNIIFITIVANKLPEVDQPRARNWGLFLAMLMRIALLFGLSFLLAMQEPFFELNLWGIHGAFSGQSLILIMGGLFLMYKSVSEIHEKLEGPKKRKSKKPATAAAFGMAVLQITVINIVFSFDSILTAVGITPHVAIMICGVVVSIAIMMMFAGPIGRFVNNHPTIQMLGLSFLILIGIMLIAEGAHKAHLLHGNDDGEVVPKGYLYFAIFFSLMVEMLNIRMRKTTSEPVQLRGVGEEAEKDGLLQ